MSKNITFVTGNKYKIAAMKEILDKYGITLQNEAIDTPEIQAQTSAEVAAFSAQWAANELKRPVIKADSGLFVAALGGLPGVYTSHFQKQLGPEKFLRLLEGEKNREAYIRYSLAYCEPGGEARIFESGCDGVIATELMGDDGMLIDYVFIPKGSTKTLGMVGDEIRDKAWGNAEAAFAEWFVKQ